MIQFPTICWTYEEVNLWNAIKLQQPIWQVCRGDRGRRARAHVIMDGTRVRIHRHFRKDQGKKKSSVTNPTRLCIVRIRNYGSFSFSSFLFTFWGDRFSYRYKQEDTKFEQDRLTLRVKCVYSLLSITGRPQSGREVVNTLQSGGFDEQESHKHGSG